MDNVFWLVLRRLRTPLLVLIGAYAVSVGGLVLIPGVDGEGQPWRFDFLHAFYFVSYMGSTIGFGEIPHPFTPAQRLWVTLCIFLTVTAWLYAIGRIFALVQESSFRNAVAEARFVRAVRRISQPFWIICGYGETGKLLVRALVRRQVQVVLLDRRQTEISQLRVESFGPRIPALCGNASDTLRLLESGMRRRLCQGVVAMTDDNDDNIRISVTAKLIRPELRVIARAGTTEAADNLSSFDTDHVIHAYSVFGEHLLMTQTRPSLHLLHAWLISLPGYVREGPSPPPRGHWIVCGYGRFGQATARALEEAGNRVTVIDSNPAKVPEGGVVGRGTVAGPLREAGIESADGIACGLDSDPNTLSAVMTARALNPDIYVIARQDQRADSTIYKAAHIDLIMEVNRMAVWRILPLIHEPLLADFLGRMRSEDEPRAAATLDRIRARCGKRTPATWALRIDADQAPMLARRLAAGQRISLGTLLRDPRERERPLPALALILQREGEEPLLMPDADVALAVGDELLLCARQGAPRLLTNTLHDPCDSAYVLDGREQPAGWLWRQLASRRDGRGGGTQASTQRHPGKGTR